MLTPEQIQQAADALMPMYRQLEAEILIKMARRLEKTIEKYDSVYYLNEKLEAIGVTKDETIEVLSEITNKSLEELQKIFEYFIDKSQSQEAEIYKKAGMKINQSTQNIKIMEAGFKKTAGIMRNLTLTAAVTAPQTFQSALDLAHMKVTSGAFSLKEATNQAIQQLVDSGITTIDYQTGARNRIDVAVRRSVRTGVAQTTRTITDQTAEEMGVDYVEISAHAGARPSHAVWQGKVIPRSMLKEITGYGTGEGLGGWNCRHSFYPFIKGVSKKAYTEKELSELDEKNINLDGKKITVYDAEQKLRTTEYMIRKYKLQAEMHTDPTRKAIATRKVKEWQYRARSICKQTNIPRRYENEKLFN